MASVIDEKNNFTSLKDISQNLATVNILLIKQNNVKMRKEKEIEEYKIYEKSVKEGIWKYWNKKGRCGRFL